MPRNDSHIPSQTKKRVFQEANSTCPFCGQREIATMEIHHIVERENGGSNDKNNLILVCANCHKKITTGDISQESVNAKKMELSRNSIHQAPVKDGSNIITGVFGNNNVVANTISVRVTSRGKSSKKSQTYPPGAIGTDLDSRNYVKYLIDRYHEYKKAEIDRTNKNLDSDKESVNPPRQKSPSKNKKPMNYTIFYSSIKREFGANWDFIPLQVFDRLVAWLHHRIDSTILGRNRKKQGRGCYSTFEQFKNKVYIGSLED